MTYLQTVQKNNKDMKGISAQGYTTDRNAKKILDPYLLEDIEKVYQSHINTSRISELESLIEMLEEMKSEKNCNWLVWVFGIKAKAGYKLAIQDTKQLLQDVIKEV